MFLRDNHFNSVNAEGNTVVYGSVSFGNAAVPGASHCKMSGGHVHGLGGICPVIRSEEVAET